MTYDGLHDLYAGRKKRFETEIQGLQKRAGRLAWTRLLLMFFVLLFAYYAWFHQPNAYALVALAAAIYLALVKKHDRVKARIQHAMILVRVNDWELSALNGDCSPFDAGEAYTDGHHPYALDLDIFGQGSVFQQISRTSSEPGRERLAAMLANPLSDPSSITSRQAAVKELSEKLEFRQEFQAIGLRTKEKTDDQRRLLEWLELPPFLLGKGSYKILLVALPVATVAALFYWILTGQAGVFVVLALVQWGIVGRHARKTNVFHDYVGNKRRLLQKFSAHFDLLSGEPFHTDQTKVFASASAEAKKEIDVLVTRVGALDLRLNLLANMLLNSTVLYDLQCVYRLEQWREKNRARLALWLQTIADTDALNSYACYAFNHPDFVFPTFNDDQRLVAKGLGHPLIARAERIVNDVNMNQGSKVWLVTGANMAGKSTFLRSVGLNTVLALTGSVVCASEMDCPLVEVYTGMRNTDSIQDHQSYFYAELLRLQLLMGMLKEDRKLLVLLDEILRGTNSADKLAGSVALISQLVRYPCLSIVATHDVALGDLETRHAGVRNYHFETEIRGDDLHFDYLLKQGISTGKNATFLMRKMGIIDSGPED